MTDRDWDAWADANHARLEILVAEIERQTVEGCDGLVTEGEVAAAIKGARRALLLMIIDPRAMIEVEEVWL